MYEKSIRELINLLKNNRLLKERNEKKEQIRKLYLIDEYINSLSGEKER